MNNTIITIGRQYGSGGHAIAVCLAERLGIPLYDKEILTESAKKSGFPEEAFQTYDEVRENSLLYALATGTTLYGAELPLSVRLCIEQFKTIRDLANEGSCIFVGRCADYVLRDRVHLASVFVHAPLENRIQRIAALHSITPQEAERLIQRTDRRRAAYYEHYTDRTWGEASTYNLTIDSSRTGINGSVELIAQYLHILGLDG